MGFTAVILLAQGLSSLGTLQDAKPLDRFAGLDSYVAVSLETWEVPGLVVAVVENGETVLTRAYGTCEIGTERKATTGTLFPIASCAKTFVAACIARLVEDGKIKWDDPVMRHLPSFRLSDPYSTEHLTIRDLLCHRTGLQRCDPLVERGDLEPGEILDRLDRIPVVADIRTRLTYSNPMYIVLGEVVARASGRPWQEVAAEHVFEPLGMTSTRSTLRDVSLDRVARRHWRSDGGIVARPLKQDEDSFHSTAGDLAKWLALCLAEGRSGDRRLFEAETVGEMQALQHSVPITSRSPDNVYAARFYGAGLGWFIQDYRGHKIVLHGGSWGSMLGMMPDLGVGVVVLSNLDLESLPGLLMYDVFDAYLLGPKVTWDPGKWRDTWLKNVSPGHAYRARDEARARLEVSRVSGTTPSLPLKEYAGTYLSPLYGPLVVQYETGELSMTFGACTTPLSHWQNDELYARAPTRLTYDWLLRFGVHDGRPHEIVVHHVGWDSDERDQIYVREE